MNLAPQETLKTMFIPSDWVAPEGPLGRPAQKIATSYAKLNSGELFFSGIILAFFRLQHSKRAPPCRMNLAPKETLSIKFIQLDWLAPEGPLGPNGPIGSQGPRGTPGALYLRMNLFHPGGTQGPKGPNGTQGVPRARMGP